MQVGVFIPIGNNGWLISTTSPQYMPTFDLLTFDDFVIGMEQFGTRIQPLMTSRSAIAQAA